MTQRNAFDFGLATLGYLALDSITQRGSTGSPPVVLRVPDDENARSNYVSIVILVL